MDTGSLPLLAADAKLGCAVTVIGTGVAHRAQRQYEPTAHDGAQGQCGRSVNTLQACNGLEEEDGLDKVGCGSKGEVDETVTQKDLDEVGRMSKLSDLATLDEREYRQDQIDYEGREEVEVDWAIAADS